MASWLSARQERRTRRRDLAEFAPGATWDVLEQMISAAHRRSPDEFAMATRRMSEGRASMERNAQLLALFLLSCCLVRLFGTSANDELIVSTARRTEPWLRQFMRVARSDIEDVLRFGVRPHASDVHETARTAILGAAVLGVIFDDPLAEIADVRESAIREVERMLAHRASM